VVRRETIGCARREEKEVSKCRLFFCSCCVVVAGVEERANEGSCEVGRANPCAAVRGPQARFASE
jgi:hypothetical protein